MTRAVWLARAHASSTRRRRCASLWIVTAALLMPAATAQQIQFTDGTQAAGIQFLNHVLVPTCAGVLAVDLNHDGYPELYYNDGMGYPNELYVNNGDGTFTEAAAQWGVELVDEITYSAVFFDYDNDNLLDLTVLTKDAAGTLRHRLFRNIGDYFIETTDAAGFGPTPGVGSLTTFDYDGDGFADVFLAESPCQTVDGPSGIVMRNNTDGTFTFLRPTTLMSVGCAPWQPVAKDVDGDGRSDVVVSSDFLLNGSVTRIFRNRPDGVLEDISLQCGMTGPANDMGLAISDYDNDGDLDVYITDISNPHGPGANRLFHSLLTEVGAFVITDISAAAGVGNTGLGWGCTFMDYDNDGWLDLAVASNNVNSKLFRNRGDRTFDDVGASIGFVPSGTASGLIAVDFDLDGDLDIAIARRANTAQLFRNDGGNTRRWLKVRLVDQATGTALPTGTRVYVTTPRHGSAGPARLMPALMTQMRELTSATSFRGQEPAELHFGVEPFTTVMELRVRWPDGTERVLRDVPTNRTVTVTRRPLHEAAGSAP